MKHSDFKELMKFHILLSDSKIPDDYKYFAADENGELHGYLQKPKKGTGLDEVQWIPHDDYYEEWEFVSNMTPSELWGKVILKL